MIRKNASITKNVGGESQYEFYTCKQCEFYECELVGEYMQPKKYGHISNVSINGNPSEIWVSPTQNDNSETNFISYIQKDVIDSCMGTQDVIQIECGKKTVTDGIGVHYRIGISDEHNIETTNDRWEPSQPVFISAQTGSGKNYFIENSLIPYVYKLNYDNVTSQKILILSNRLALQYQMEKRIGKDDDKDSADGKIYRYRNRNRDDNNTYVMTYQSLLNNIEHFKNIQKQKDSKYIYVVCDEAHFFTSDAMFNPHTQKILSAIVELFQDAVRIYMSATPYECVKYIINTEKELESYYPMAFYHFKRDYSYLDINTYSEIENLYDEIVTSVNNQKKKWLIFIDNIEQCKNVKNELEKHGAKTDKPMIDKNSKISKIYVVDATGKEDETFREIISNEELGKDTYVLISTSVIDNGVNLNDIDNIVISDMSRVKSLQMVGRARVKKKDGAFERKTLYIKRFDETYIRRRLFNLGKLKDAYHHYELAYNERTYDEFPNSYHEYHFLNKYYDGNKENWENAKRLFGRSPEKPDELYLNEIAKSLLDKLIVQYQFICDDMENEQVVGQQYLEYQLAWFGRKYSAENDIPLIDKEKSKKEFINFIKPYADANIQMDKEKQEIFREKFTKLYDKAFGREDKNISRIYSIDKMNKLLTKQNTGYTLKSVGKPVCWVVEKKKRRLMINKSDLNSISIKKKHIQS